MTELIGNIDPGLPLILILLALLGFRWPVTARASLWIKAPVAKVFALIELRDGASQAWHRAKVDMKLVDPATQRFRIQYVSTANSGVERVFHADFRTAESHPPNRLVLDRAGIEGRSTNNELLRIETDLAPEADGTRLRIAYHWGPRPLIAQLLARSDLYGGAYRLKGVAETGRPDLVTDTLISGGMAVLTGAMTLVGFGLWFGWDIAILLLAALFIHEFGHLLAFRLIGQPWGRLLFLPFLGAIAMPRLSFERASQSVFSALMGPGFSVVIPVLAAVAVYNGAPAANYLVKLGLVAGALNLFNLLPVEPLDGGVAMRSIFGRIFGGSARFGMMGLGALILIGGIYLREPVLAVFGGISILANARPRQIDQGLAPLSSAELAASFVGFGIVAAGHGIGFLYLLLHR